MKQKYLWPILETLGLLLVLQLIPVYIKPEWLLFNDHFILGYFGANNLAIILLVAFSYLPILLLEKSDKRIVRFSSVILLASILSNLLDRIFRGGATDYISISNWPTFNLADVLIIVAVVILGLNYLSPIKKPRS
ncbi:MAG: signal peptidase II [Candidatus Berkelbacteria bacterium]|nr:signal peptidase II [Candidatus Berkelbacteria bacterium]